MDTQDPPIRLVVELDDVEVDVRVDQRLRYLAEHMGMDRARVAERILEMVFRDDLGWEDIEYVRTLTDPAVAPSDGDDLLAGLAALDVYEGELDEA